MTWGRAAQHGRKWNTAPQLAIVRTNMCALVYVHAGADACVSGKGTTRCVSLSSACAQLLCAGWPQNRF